jgi:hypothetical protein
MTQKYTPTDNDVKAGYVRAFCGARDTLKWAKNSVKGERAFNRWLAAHDAQIRADAGDEGFTKGRDLAVSGQLMSRNNPYKEQKQ